MGHSRPWWEAQLPPLYGSVHLPSRLVEAQVPPIGGKDKLPPLYPGTVTVRPERRPNSLLHTGVCTTLVVGFSLANKNPGVHGADLYSFHGALCHSLPHFQPNQVVVIVISFIKDQMRGGRLNKNLSLSSLTFAGYKYRIGLKEIWNLWQEMHQRVLVWRTDRSGFFYLCPIIPSIHLNFNSRGLHRLS